MKIKLSVILVLVLSGFAATANAQTNRFTYQGRLSDGATAANGTYRMQIALFDAPTGTGQIGSTVTFDGAAGNPPAVTVVNGVFTVQLDFGAGAFAAGADRFIELRVFNPSTSTYITLTPRQQLTSAPYSIRTSSSSSADSLSAACVTCVADAQIGSVAGSKVTGTVANATTAAGVSGIVPIANGGTGSGTQNFVDLTTNQPIGGDKTFTGTIGGNGAGLTNVNAASGGSSASDYVFSYATIIQTAALPNLFQDINFNLNGLIDGWTHIPGTPSFTCMRTGVYSIQYNALASSVTGVNVQISLRVTQNGTEVLGSQSALELATTGTPLPVSRSFIALFNTGDVLRLQFAASNGSGRLEANFGSGSIRPSATITIIKIQ
jgi:hypothetical protein